MNCVHCGAQNSAGQELCISCGRVVANLEEWPPDLHEWVPPGSAPSVTSRLALAALALGLLAVFPIAGLAAIILGHLALSQITRSEGSLRGRDVARLALICGYSGLIVFCALFFGTAWYSRVPLRSLVSTLSAAPSAPSAPDARPSNTSANANEIQAIQTLVQVHMAEGLYARKHLLSSYTCDVSQLRSTGLPAQALSKLSDSGYVVTIQQCKQNEAGVITGYNALAVSRVGIEGRNFCTDETGIIRVPSIESGLLNCSQTGTPLR